MVAFDLVRYLFLVKVATSSDSWGGSDQELQHVT